MKRQEEDWLPSVLQVQPMYFACLSLQLELSDRLTGRQGNFEIFTLLQ